MRIFRITLALLFAVATGLSPSRTVAQDLTLCISTPTTLQNTLFHWNQTIDASIAGPPTYALRFDGVANGLGEDVHLDALALLPGDRFLFSTDGPFTAGATTYEPRDVVRRDGPSAYSMFLAGATLGLEPGTNIDAVALDPSGRVVLSFDAPVTVGAATFMPNDLVVVNNGALSLLVSGAAIGLPDDVNVTGYEALASGGALFQFDAPVELGAQSFLPSDVAAFTSGTWSLFFHDPAFPPDSAGSDFALPCAGPAYGGVLRAGKLAGTTELSWSAGGAARFDLVRGDLNTLRATGGNFTQALDAILPVGDVCMADDTVALSASDLRPDPSTGQGYFYLLRAVAGCGAGGTHDVGGGQLGSRDIEIAAAAGACP